MFNNTRNLLILLMCLFFVGFGISMYPFVHGIQLDSQQRAANAAFFDFVDDTPNLETAVESPDSPYAGDPLWDAAAAYNEQLFATYQRDLISSAAFEAPCLDLEAYGLPDGIFGVISIPAISVQMPIYLGASKDNLARGAAHLSQTSLPIGGENTCCVIAGHRGWQGGLYFKNLPALKPGDLVYLQNVWEQLEYEVIENTVIYPADTDAIKIQPGRDLLMLITCDYSLTGIKGRCLIICERKEAVNANQ